MGHLLEMRRINRWVWSNSNHNSWRAVFILVAQTTTFVYMCHIYTCRQRLRQRSCWVACDSFPDHVLNYSSIKLFMLNIYFNTVVNIIVSHQSIFMHFLRMATHNPRVFAFHSRVKLNKTFMSDYNWTSLARTDSKSQHFNSYTSDIVWYTHTHVQWQQCYIEQVSSMLSYRKN